MSTPNIQGSRVKKTLLNVRVNFIIQLLTLFLTFFSRKIFLEYLNADFVGLTGTLSNILGYLNLAELGIGSAIAFNLYKPLHYHEHDKIIKLVSLFGYYYRNIGLIVLGAGIIISIFFPLIFKDSNFPFEIIYFAFFSFLSSSLIGYFLNYRATVLSADQKDYLVTGYIQGASLLKTIIQLIFAYYTSNCYIWIGLELTFSIITSFILNWKIDRTYPWLRCSIKLGKNQSKDFPNILKSTKQIFVHKIKDFILTQSDQLFVFAFASLKMVAYYGNYVVVISRTWSFLSTVLNSVGASIGNLVAENNKPKMIQVFWEIMALRFFLAGFICFSIYQLIDPFITLWLGEEYLLQRSILIFLIVNQFIMMTRGAIDQFNAAFGHYADTWTAWVEGIINLTVTIIGGYFWGIPGVLLGKTASIVPIVVFWKPLYLFKEGFQVSYRKYWKGTIRYYIIFIICCLITHFILKFIPINPYLSFGWWFIFAIISASSFGFLYLTGIIVWGYGGKNLFSRLPLDKVRLKF